MSAKHPHGRFRPVEHIPHYSRLFWTAMQTPLLTFLALTGNAVMFSASLAFWWVERGSNPQVSHYADALWWAFATVSTVGYGDVVPVTAVGRAIAIVLIITGVFFFVVFGATLATVILGLATEEARQKDDAIAREEAARILRELAALRRAIDEVKNR